MLSIDTLEVTPFQQNARVITAQGSLDALIIDPGGDAPVFIDHFKRKNLVPKEIWLTHSHIDHCGGVFDLLKEFPEIILKASLIENDFRGRVEQICDMYSLPPGEMKNCPEPHVGIKKNDILTFGGVSFKALFTPGHSPGHFSFYCESENLVISGDALFSGSIGRTDLPGADYSTLLDSIKKELLTLPHDTMVLSGHGSDTTIGKEAKSNPFLVKR